MERDAQVGLAEAVRAIRSELAQAMAEGFDNRLRFEVGPVELEFNVELKQDISGKAGVKVWVISGETATGRAETTAHKMKVTLKPIDAATGEAPKVSSTVEAAPGRPN